MLKLSENAVLHNGLIAAFAVVGIIIWLSGVISRRLTFGHVHGSCNRDRDWPGTGIATRLIKAIMVMGGTSIAARFLVLKTPYSAMVFGSLAGTASGVSAGLAAMDRKLAPYGALVATFHTFIGYLLGPSVLFFTTKIIVE